MIKRCLTVIAMVFLLVGPSWAAGAWNPAGNRYTPQLTTQGITDYNQIVISEQRTDARLGASPYYGGASTIAGALTNIGATAVDMTIPSGTWVGDSATFPANVNLKVQRGALITVGNGQTLTANCNIEAGPYQIFSCTGTGKVVGLKLARPEWFGTGGAALTLASQSLASDGILLFSSSTLSISTAASITLPGNQTWQTEGRSVVQCSAAGEIAWIANVDPGTYNLTINGPIVFDANSKARRALSFENTLSGMPAAPNLLIRDAEFINARSTTSGDAAMGLYTKGSFSHVTTYNVRAYNITRTSGLSTSCDGIATTYNVTTGGYPRNVTHFNPMVDTVTTADADPLDCDGIMASGPTASQYTPSGDIPDTTLTIVGGTIKNCATRSIKSQMEHNDFSQFAIFRNMTSYSSGVEIDCQYGSGRIHDFDATFEPDGVASPFGVSYAFAKATCRGLFAAEGNINIYNGRISINASSTMPYFFLPAFVDSGVLQQCVIDNIKFEGDGQVNRLVYGDFSKIKRGRITNNLFSSVGYCLIQNTGGDCGELPWVINNNSNRGVTVRPLIVNHWLTSQTIEIDTVAKKLIRASGSWVDDGIVNGTYGLLGSTSIGNDGNYVIDAVTALELHWSSAPAGVTSEAGSGTQSFLISMPPLLVNPGYNYGFDAQVLSAGEYKSIDDNGFALFCKQEMDMYTLYAIKSDYGATACGIFSRSTTPIDLTGGASSSIAYSAWGAAVDAGKLGVRQYAGPNSPSQDYIVVYNWLGDTYTVALSAK